MSGMPYTLDVEVHTRSSEGTDPSYSLPPQVTLLVCGNCHCLIGDQGMHAYVCPGRPRQ